MNALEIGNYLRDRQVPLWRKGVGLFALIYAVWPLDFIPDAIPIIGWLDDLGILGLASWFFIRQVRKHAARKALEPSPVKKLIDG